MSATNSSAAVARSQAAEEFVADKFNLNPVAAYVDR